MKRLLLILTIASVTLCQTVHAQYYSVNYDTRTVAAMVAAFGTEAVAEGYYREQVDDVLKHYTAAEVATAGIFAAKFLEHKALSDLGIWNSRTENYYYRRIRSNKLFSSFGLLCMSLVMKMDPPSCSGSMVRNVYQGEAMLSPNTTLYGWNDLISLVCMRYW